MYSQPCRLTVEYPLTRIGQTLTEPLAALAAWAQRHGDDLEAARHEYDRKDI